MKQPSIKKNYIFTILYEVLTIITSFVTVPYTSRVLGADNIGIYSYSASIMAYFTLLAGLGTKTYGTRAIARCRNNKEHLSRTFWEIELLTIITTSVCLAAWLVFVIFFVGSNTGVYFALIPLLFATMFDISWFYAGEERISYSVILNSLFKISGAVAIFVFVNNREDLIRYVFIHSSVSCFSNLTMWVYLHRFITKPGKGLNILPHLRQTFIYFIPTVAISVYTVLDKTMIGLITNDSFQNGFYEQANRIISITKTLAFASVNAAMGARISFLHSENKSEEIQRRIHKSADYILFVSLGCMFGIIAVSGIFVPIVFGEGYEPVAPILMLMSPLVPIIGISSCLNHQYFTPVGQIKITAKIVSIGAGINLILNFFLIQKFGAVGATAASVITELMITVIFLSHSKELLSMSDVFHIGKRKLLAGAAMLIVLTALQRLFPSSSVIRLIILIITGIAIYFILLILMKDQTAKELTEIIRGLFKIGKKE